MTKYDHLVFTIHEKHIEFRLGNQMGTDPIGDKTPEEVIAYLRKMIPHTTYEILN